MSDADKYQGEIPPGPSDAPAGAVISSDTARQNRIPPGQVRTKKWPVLHWGDVPTISLDRWKLEISGLVEQPLTFTWEEYQKLPRGQVFADFHCVTRWSRLGNVWEGVLINEIIARCKPLANARYVLAKGYDQGWTTNLPLADFIQPDAILADRHDGQPLSADHGGPVRLIVPRLFAWKSAKWLRKISFLNEDTAGYWEQAGYHMHGDPWIVDAANKDGERYRDDAEWLASRRGQPAGANDLPPDAF